MALAGAMHNRASTLPAELLSLIFGALPQPALLCAAAVCAWWRANAVRAPSYYRASTFTFPSRRFLPLIAGADAQEIYSLKRLIADSEAGGYGLGLRVFLELQLLPQSPSTTEDEYDVDEYDVVDIGPQPVYQRYTEDSEAVFEDLMVDVRETVLPVLRRAVSRCVVLSIVLDAKSASITLNGLSGPAPLLRSLTINMSSIYQQRGPCELPTGFLASTAPRLREVALISVGIPAQSVLRFPAVRSLRFSCPDETLHLDHICAAFPNVRSLAVEAKMNMYPDYSNAGIEFLSQLQELRFGPQDFCFAGLRDLILDVAKHVPYIEYRGPAVRTFAPLLNLSGDLSLCLSEHERGGDTIFPGQPQGDFHRFSQLCVELRSRDIVRCVDSDAPSTRVYDLLSSAGCMQSVTELTIDDRHLVTFMKTCGKRMPRLAALRLTLVLWAAPKTDESMQGLRWMQFIRKGNFRFDDDIDGVPPCGDFEIKWPSLASVELRATRPHSVISEVVLSSLAQTFNRRLRLTLSNGLTLALDAQGPATAALFSEIQYADSRFHPELDFVARVRKLRQTAGGTATPTEFEGSDFSDEDEPLAPATSPTSVAPSSFRFKFW